MSLDFQSFQQAFGAHLRDPHHAPRPAGVPARRARAYRELLFNNICGVIDACFPVCREMLGQRRWLQLQRKFFAEWRSQSPLFCELPREFLRWLEGADVSLPAYQRELAYYEWAELAVDIMPTAPLPAFEANADLMQGRPAVTPAHMLLSSQWPVHRIGPDYRPRKAQPTQLVVYRDADEQVQFAVINAVTARLIALLAPGQMTGRAACLQIAAELQHPQPEVVVTGGSAMLNQLKDWGVIHGAIV